MDEMKIRTKFAKNLISGILHKVIYKKTGCHVDIVFDDIDVKNDDVGVTTAHINMRITASNSELKALLHGKNII